jgi:hypothetical protein
MTKDRQLVPTAGPTELDLTRARIADFAQFLRSRVDQIPSLDEADYAEEKLKEIFVYLGWKKE